MEMNREKIEMHTPNLPTTLTQIFFQMTFGVTLVRKIFYC